MAVLRGITKSWLKLVIARNTHVLRLYIAIGIAAWHLTTFVTSATTPFGAISTITLLRASRVRLILEHKLPQQRAIFYIVLIMIIILLLVLLAVRVPPIQPFLFD
jgi:hypothetical protein